MTRMGMIAGLLKDKGPMFRNGLISLINRWRYEENGTQLVDEVVKSGAVIVDKRGRVSLPGDLPGHEPEPDGCIYPPKHADPDRESG